MLNDEKIVDIEIAFFEPALGLIISNLEFLEEELDQLELDTRNLTLLLDEFNAVEDIFLWDGLVLRLGELTKSLEPLIFNLGDDFHHKLLGYLYTAQALASHLQLDSFLIQRAMDIQRAAGVQQTTQQASTPVAVTQFQQTILEKVHQLLLNLKTRTEMASSANPVAMSAEAKSLLKILGEENDFAELKTGMDLLLGLYASENPLTASNSEALTFFRTLNDVTGLVDLFLFWEQDELMEASETEE